MESAHEERVGKTNRTQLCDLQATGLENEPTEEERPLTRTGPAPNRSRKSPAAAWGGPLYFDCCLQSARRRERRSRLRRFAALLSPRCGLRHRLHRQADRELGALPFRAA